jgi:hypothetical protein
MFKHWIDADKDSCNTRAEALKAEAVIAPAQGANCTLTGGEWYSPYDDQYIQRSRGLDIDHLVPLAEAGTPAPPPGPRRNVRPTPTTSGAHPGTTCAKPIQAVRHPAERLGVLGRTGAPVEDLLRVRSSMTSSWSTSSASGCGSGATNAGRGAGRPTEGREKARSIVAELATLVDKLAASDMVRAGFGYDTVSATAASPCRAATGATAAHGVTACRP